MYKIVNKNNKIQLYYLGYAGIIGIIAFVLSIVVLHATNPSINSFTNYVSDYANAQLGELFQIGLIIHGLGNIALATGLIILFAKQKQKKIGVVLFSLVAIGAILSGIFPKDPPLHPRSISGTIHIISATLAFPLEAVALIYISKAFKNIVKWRHLVTYTQITMIVGSILLVWFGIDTFTKNLVGLAERLVLLIFLLWEIVISINFVKTNKN